MKHDKSARSAWTTKALTATVFLAACAMLAFKTPAHGATPEWSPSEKVVLVTHASAGTGIDVFLRRISDIWTRHQILPQSVAVENITGGRGEKARRHVASQNRGNPHLLFGYTPSQINTALLAKSELGVGSFTPIALMAVEPLVLYVRANGQFKGIKDLVDAARRSPKSVRQGGGPFGNVPSLVGRMLAEEAGASFAYVPFRGGGEGVIALLGGHVDFVMEQPSEVHQHVKAGKLKPLAASERLDMYPDVPTFASAGFTSKVLKQFRGVVAPPGISPAAARFYINALDRARGTSEWKQYVTQNELLEQWITGQQLAAFLAEQEQQYERLLAKDARPRK